MLNNFIGRRYKTFQVNDIEPYKFKKKDFPHNRYFFFSEHPDIEDFISNEFIELLKTDFQTNNIKYKTVGFFRKSPCHYLMLLNIAESSIKKKSITFEGMLKSIPDKIGSRSKIFQILKDVHLFAPLKL